MATLNALLKAPEFWGELRGAGADRVLFFQTDSLLVHGGIQPFLQVGGLVESARTNAHRGQAGRTAGRLGGRPPPPSAATCTHSRQAPGWSTRSLPPQYDYVGAPWHRKNERWGPKQAAMPQGVGNGGLSLRSVPTMEALARAYGNTSGTQQVGGVHAWGAHVRAR